MIDTCQANSMFSKFYSPNILATGSSEVGENSYSVSSSLYLFINCCCSVFFSMQTIMTLELPSLILSLTISWNIWKASIRQVKCPCGISSVSYLLFVDASLTRSLPQFNIYDPAKISSHPGVRTDLFRRPIDRALITDFFGGVSRAEVAPPTEESIGVELDVAHLSTEAATETFPAKAPTFSPYKPLTLESSPHDTNIQWTIRMWTGLLLTGGLLVWVFQRPTQRKSIH